MSVILGNHDEFLFNPAILSTYTEVPIIVQAVDWCRAELSTQELDFLRGFQATLAELAELGALAHLPGLQGDLHQALARQVHLGVAQRGARLDIGGPRLQVVPEPLRGHEFHYSSLENLAPDQKFVYRVVRGHGVDGERDGIVHNNVLASYAHLRSGAGSDWAASRTV